MFGDFKPSIQPSAVLTFSAGAEYLCAGGAIRYTRPRIVDRSRSPMLWPPTPGSFQSATNTEPSGATHTSEGRNQSSSLVSRFSMVALYPAPFGVTGYARTTFGPASQ